MGVLDFLFEGSAPTPGTRSTSSQIQLPEWYTQYTTDMLGRAQAAANLPYAQYTGPRIAGFTPTEETGFEMAKGAAGAYQPFLSQAGAALGQAGSISGAGAAAGDFARAAGMMGGAAAQPFLSQAAGMSGARAAEPGFARAEGMSAAGAAQPFFGQASGISGADVMRPFAQQGIGSITRAGETSTVPLAEKYFQQAIEASPLQAAQPYMSAASRTFPQAAQEYMSPYIKNVVDEISKQGVRQLQEKYLPAVGQEFIGAGQFSVGPGSTRMGEFGARALRDVQEAVLAEQAKALQAGYGQAADIYGRDVARFVDLAGTAGQLGTAQQRALLESGSQVGQLATSDLSRLLQSGQSIADIGAKMGSLSAEDASRLIQMGQATGQLTAQDASRLADIAQARGQLTGQDAARIAELGQITGQLTAQDARTLADIGQARGQLATQDAQALRDLASRYGALGETAQGLGLRGAEAVTGVGAKERAMRQANLDLAYQDFLKQEQYPKEQIQFLSNILKGINLPQTTITQTTETPAQPGGASGIEKGIAGATGVGTILDLLKKYGFGESEDNYDYDFFADYFDNLGQGD